MQLQLEDERIRKKNCDFQRRKELERRQKVACVQRSDRDVAQAPEGIGDEGGDAAFSTVDAGSHGSDMPMKTNLMQTRLTQVFTRDAVKEKKVVLKRKMLDRNPDGTQRRSPHVKAGSQPGNSKADGDSVSMKIGPSKLGGSPVRRSPRILTNKKPSSPPLRERSLLKENNKRKVHPAKVNRGVKKRAHVEAEDVVSEEDDIEVDSEDEFAVRIDPDTMTLDMGEANKKLRITSNGIQQLFGFPRGGRSPPRPSEDGYDDALMKLRSELDISRNIDIKTKDLRNKLKVLVKDPRKDDLALKVFFIIVFMKVVLPGAAPRVSREAAMFEGLVFEDMANMDYCQLMVDELRRAVVGYQDGVTMGKAITGYAIGPVLMYLDCLIRGKTAEPDMRVPSICFMDLVKLSDLIEQDEAAATDSRAGDGTEANVPNHETNDVGLERVVDDIEQDEAAATDSRADDGTEANVSDHHTNDVGLEQPVVDETSHNVDVAIDRGVNDPSTDKCKGLVGDVAFNVSNNKIDDVSVNASKMTDVDREAVVSGGDDAHGVPLSSGRDVGAKVADEDFGVASILDGKPSGVGIAENENLSDFEDLPPENFPLGGLDYGDALQGASSVEEVPSKDDDLLLSISSAPLTQEALVSSQDFLSIDLESVAILVSSQDVHVPSSNPETRGILVSSQELPSSSNTDSTESGNVVKVDIFFFAVTRLRTNRAKRQFSELGRVSIDLSQWRSPEKTRSGVALKGSTATCAESPSTPNNPIVELIDSDDDVFDKIAGMGRVTRSVAAAKGLSPLAGIVARRAGGARKDPALDSGNVTRTKRAPRAPIKFCSPVQQLQPHRFPHLDKARKLYNLLLSDEACENNTFSMIPQPDDSVTSFTGKRIWEVFAPGQMMEGDVMDFLIDDWKKDPDRNVDFASVKRVFLSPYFITVVLDCMFYGDENKEFNVKSAARDFKSYVKDTEDLLSADLIMMPLFKPMVLPKDKKVNHFSLYVMNRYRSSVDILDSLPYPKNHRPSKNTYHKDCEKIISRMVQVMKDVYGDAQYNASKQPKWELFAKKPMFVKVPLQGANECGHYTLKYAGSYDGEKIVGNIRDKDPRIVDWKAEDLYRVVFNRNNGFW
ncbi:hypothetical protein VPH35_019810 [Triticum aestivum]